MVYHSQYKISQYSQIQNSALTRTFGYFHYLIIGLTISFETNYKPMFLLKYNSCKCRFNKWLVSWGTPSPSSTPGENFLETSSVKTSHFKKVDDMWEIAGMEPYSAWKISAWFSYPRTDIPASMSLLCHKPYNSALFKKNKLQTQKSRKTKLSRTTRSVRCPGHVEVSQSQHSEPK